MGSAHRTCWRVFVGALVGSGLAAGSRVLSPPTAVALVLPMCCLGALYGYLWSPFVPSVRHLWLRVALVAGASGPVLAGLFHLFGGAAALLLAAAVVTAPGLLSRLVRPEGTGSAGPGRAVPDAAGSSEWPTAGPLSRDVAVLRDAVARMSGAELDRAWRATGASLSRGPAAERRLLLCQVREVLLEELEQRDPESFRRWLPDALAAPQGPRIPGPLS